MFPVILGLQSGFQLSVESNCAFALVLLHSELCDWFPKFAPFCQPMRNKTNRASLARLFPRLVQVTWICFEFCLIGPLCC